MPRPIRDMGASVRARLLNFATANNRDFNLLLVRFKLERLIYRLSLTPHGSKFILKGAMLVTSWFDVPHRPTRDLDFLAYGSNEPQAMVDVFREVCALELDDGVRFDAASIRTEPIREHIEYGGVRLLMLAHLAKTRTPLTIDIGFGDAVVPPDQEITLPVLLDLPAPRIRAYARETVIAEKAHAVVELGLLNSRMKDFYDLWVISRAYEFEAERVGAAISATFGRRETPIPQAVPVGLTEAFSCDETKLKQWAAFARALHSDTPPFGVIVGDVRNFLMPHFTRLYGR